MRDKLYIKIKSSNPIKQKDSKNKMQKMIKRIENEEKKDEDWG